MQIINILGHCDSSLIFLYKGDNRKVEGQIELRRGTEPLVFKNINQSKKNQKPKYRPLDVRIQEGKGSNTKTK